MRILMVLTYYYPHWTGLTAYAQRTAEGLAARGHSVTVLTTRHLHSLPRDEMVNGVRVVRLQPAARISRGMVTPAFPLAAARLIAQHDAVQIHTPLMESLIVAVLCRLIGRPLVMTHHGDLTMPAGLMNRVVELTVTAMMKAAGLLATRVSSYSRDYAANSPFLRPFTDRLAYIYPPVEIPRPRPAEAQLWRRELGLETRLLVGFAGRFVEEKGFDYLLRAIPLIRRRFPQAHFVYAGEHRIAYEDFYEKCRPLIEENAEHITFLGLILDRQKLADFYSMCDVFTLPSRTDCLAIVQVEALLCGTPLVTSDIPGARVVVQETSGGLLAKPGDVQALADGICTVLADPESYTVGEEAVREIFDGRRSITQFEQLFSDVVKGRSTTDSTSWRSEATDAVKGSTGEVGHAALSSLLRNETDVAYSRRAHLLLDYLELKPDDRVLDCGCGMGFYLRALREVGDFALVGIDGDPVALDYARRQMDGRDVSLAFGNIERLPFADESFDKILCTEVLEHLEDDRAGLLEIWRVLRPGGVLAVTVPNASYPFCYDPVNRVLEDCFGRSIRSGPLAGIWALHRRLYTREQLETAILGADFEIEDSRWLTHHCFPFTQNVVYGIGKPLIQRGLLPDSIAKSTDRFRSHEGDDGVKPIQWILGLFRVPDIFNDVPALTASRHAINIALKARKP